MVALYRHPPWVTSELTEKCFAILNNSHFVMMVASPIHTMTSLTNMIKIERMVQEQGKHDGGVLGFTELCRALHYYLMCKSLLPLPILGYFFANATFR